MADDFAKPLPAMLSVIYNPFMPAYASALVESTHV
jgi:hypothetical protein